MNDRFKLQKVGGKWICTDLCYKLSCDFVETQFNETQRFEFPPDIMVGKTPNDLAQIANDMAEWLKHHHYPLLIPRDSDIREVIGNSLRSIRQRRGMTQQEVADICGLSQTHIARIEQGRYNTTIDVVDKVAKALGVFLTLVDYK